MDGDWLNNQGLLAHVAMEHSNVQHNGRLLRRSCQTKWKTDTVMQLNGTPYFPLNCRQKCYLIAAFDCTLHRKRDQFSYPFNRQH